MSEEIITSLAYEPGPDGTWSGTFYVCPEGRMTHDPEEGVLETSIEAPPGTIWCFERGQWRVPAVRGDGFLHEIQWVDGQAWKENHTDLSAQYQVLLDEFRQARGGDGDGWPSTLSRNIDGKLSAYFVGGSDDLARVMAEFGAPARNWAGTHSISVLPSGEPTLKLYDRDVDKYPLPELPEGAHTGPFVRAVDPVRGVACTFIAGVEQPMQEIYFTADREAVEEWAGPLGLVLPDRAVGVDYWGVVFDPGLDIAHLKALRWVAEEVGEVERCWVAGVNVRTGYHRLTDEAQAILSRVPDRYLVGTITNVGANEYDLGEHGRREILSIYFNGEVSQHRREQFGVPEHVVPAPWFGLKYCPELDCEWLKLADLDYSRYTLPDIPENAHRAFGVATVYARGGDQPPVHNADGDGWRDCSFITRDHAAVRRWCLEHGIDDPAPHLPDTLILLGVYSITHHADTGEIKRLKFYDYHTGQRYDMELYLEAVLAGRAAGLPLDQPLLGAELIQSVRARVNAFTQQQED